MRRQLRGTQISHPQAVDIYRYLSSAETLLFKDSGTCAEEDGMHSDDGERQGDLTLAEIAMLAHIARRS